MLRTTRKIIYIQLHLIKKKMSHPRFFVNFSMQCVQLDLVHILIGVQVIVCMLQRKYWLKISHLIVHIYAHAHPRSHIHRCSKIRRHSDNLFIEIIYKSIFCSDFKRILYFFTYDVILFAMSYSS